MWHPCNFQAYFPFLTFHDLPSLPKDTLERRRQLLGRWFNQTFTRKVIRRPIFVSSAASGTVPCSNWPSKTMCFQAFGQLRTPPGGQKWQNYAKLLFLFRTLSLLLLLFIVFERLFLFGVRILKILVVFHFFQLNPTWDVSIDLPLLPWLRGIPRLQDQCGSSTAAEVGHRASNLRLKDPKP